MSELLATQREIASEITQNLRLKLSGEGEKALTKRYTDNNEAYQLYLQGRFHYAKRTKDDMLRAIEYFQQATQLEPNFPLAYVGVSESYGLMPSYAYLSPKEAYPQAKAAAQRALTIDPSLAEAHAALATTFTLYDWNWVSAESEYEQAIELNPNVAETHYRYGLSYLIPMGRTDEGIREIKRALELEPLSIAMSANLAGAFMYARQNDLALKQAQETYNLEPSHITARVWLGYIYDSQGMYTEAIALSEKSLQTTANDMDSLFIAGYAYAKMGRRPEAEKILNTFKEAEKARYVEPYDSAAIYAALGDKDKAFAELERDFTERDFYITFLKVDPFMDPLRDDPRFKDLVRRIGLPQ